MIGERNEINQQQWDIFRKTGTVHFIGNIRSTYWLGFGVDVLFVLQISIKLSTVFPSKIAAIAALLFALILFSLGRFFIANSKVINDVNHCHDSTCLATQNHSEQYRFPLLFLLY